MSEGRDPNERLWQLLGKRSFHEICQFFGDDAPEMTREYVKRLKAQQPDEQPDERASIERGEIQANFQDIQLSLTPAEQPDEQEAIRNRTQPDEQPDEQETIRNRTQPDERASIERGEIRANFEDIQLSLTPAEQLRLGDQRSPAIIEESEESALCISPPVSQDLAEEFNHEF